mmetsp:Transcript_90856/g.261794  ORF Transcript_90856/g.261794 Transcript_90856/m.261794 type:complete len:244 (+) Transcript_90856:994-1725(+)
MSVLRTPRASVCQLVPAEGQPATARRDPLRWFPWLGGARPSDQGALGRRLRRRCRRGCHAVGHTLRADGAHPRLRTHAGVHGSAGAGRAHVGQQPVGDPSGAACHRCPAALLLRSCVGRADSDCDHAARRLAIYHASEQLAIRYSRSRDAVAARSGRTRSSDVRDPGVGSTAIDTGAGRAPSSAAHTGSAAAAAPINAVAACAAAGGTARGRAAAAAAAARCRATTAAITAAGCSAPDPVAAV